jgi:hypothetical protein
MNFVVDIEDTVLIARRQVYFEQTGKRGKVGHWKV